MAIVRRKPLTLAMLGNFRLPEKLVRIEANFAVSAEDFRWLKFGHVSDGSADFTGVYAPDEQALYIFSSFVVKSKSIHWFICRLQFQEIGENAHVLYAEVDGNPANKNLLGTLSPLGRYGWRFVADDEIDWLQIPPSVFERAIRDLVRYIQATVQPYKRPDDVYDLPLERFSTPIQMLITERAFYHLLWGVDGLFSDRQWFAYMENMILYWHRTATGYCYFHIKFKKIDESYLAYEIVSFKESFEPELGLELTEELLKSRNYEYELV